MTKVDLSTYGGRLRDVGYAGGIVDQNKTTIETFVNEGATAVDFGMAVARGAADNTCKAPAADADEIIGISAAHRIKASAADGTVVYAQYDAVPVVEEGRIYVKAAENVTRGDIALSLTAKSGAIGGKTGGAAGDGRVAIPRATWETTTAKDAIGIVKINR